jgi:hypothetical protein
LKNSEAAQVWAVFFLTCCIWRAEVFNTFVENAVEKRRSSFVTDSMTRALAFCTGVVAGTLVVLLRT